MPGTSGIDSDKDRNGRTDRVLGDPAPRFLADQLGFDSARRDSRVVISQFRAFEFALSRSQPETVFF